MARSSSGKESEEWEEQVGGMAVADARVRRTSSSRNMMKYNERRTVNERVFWSWMGKFRTEVFEGVLGIAGSIYRSLKIVLSILASTIGEVTDRAHSRSFSIWQWSRYSAQPLSAPRKSSRSNSPV